SFIHSHIQYAICSWGGVYESTLKYVVLLQKRAIRLVCNASFLEHSLSLFIKCNVLPIYAFCIVNYAIKYNLIDNLPRSRQRRNLYVCPFKPNSTRFRNSYYLHLVKLLNKIPPGLLTSRDSIKKFIFNIDINQILYGINI